jgi:uncharacterized membrane protein YhaH (DUF805 family)
VNSSPFQSRSVSVNPENWAIGDCGERHFCAGNQNVGLARSHGTLSCDHRADAADSPSARGPHPKSGAFAVDRSRLSRCAAALLSGYFSFRGRASRTEFWWQRLTDSVVVILALWLVPVATPIPNDPSPLDSYQNVLGYLGIGQSVFGLFFGTDGRQNGFTILHGGPPTQWVLFGWFIVTLTVRPGAPVGRVATRFAFG